MNLIGQTTIKHYLESQRALVDRELEKILPPGDEYPAVIHQAMRHSVFAGGKRLRPILCLESARLFGAEEESLLRLASGLELIHTYSLIHDDLPALDNDDLRRGKPTCHRAFGEAMAILAGDALLTQGFEVLAAPGPPRPELKVRVINELAQAIGTRGGMVGGQVMDLKAATGSADAGTLEYIHSAKTGAFIRAAARSGAVYADASEEDLERISNYGQKIGLAFQIADDLLDVLGSEETTGKTVHKDQQQRKLTYPALHGVEKSQQIAADLVREACIAIEPYGSKAERLQQIAHFLISRNS